MIILRIKLIILCVLLSCYSLSCTSGAEPETVSFDIPFSGALTSDSRVLAVDGAALTGASPISALRTKSQAAGAEIFSCFDRDGNTIGRAEYARGMMSTPTTQGIQTLFTMPVCFRVDGENEACAESMQFVEFACGPDINVCPDGTTCLRGAAAGLITSGIGSFRSVVGRRTIEQRYARCARSDGSTALQVHAAVLLNR